MDILQPLAMEKWPLLLDLLRRNWPIYGYQYNWVTNAIKWKKKDFKNINIYCPDGKPDSGIFVGITYIPYCEVFAFSFKESQDLLLKALTETKLINWNQYIFFASVHQHCDNAVSKAINNVIKKGNNYIMFKTVTNYFFKPKEECLKINFTVPDDCEIKPLDTSHVPLIHSIWPHRLEKTPELTIKLLETLVTLNSAIGIFLKKDNSLVSWILNSNIGGLMALQTLEEHKRKGYGRLCVQAMSKKLAEEENLDSILFIVENNAASLGLFESLGYTRLVPTTWCGVGEQK